MPIHNLCVKKAGGGLCVLGILLSCACICTYACTSVCLNMWGGCQYSCVCGPVHVCMHVWVLCVVPQLSAKAPGMIPYSYFPFRQFSIIL